MGFEDHTQLLPTSSVVAGGDGPGGWSGQEGYRCPSLSGVPVPDWCSPGSSCSSRSLCTWRPPAPLGGLGEEGCLSSPRCSLPRWPVLGLPSPQCQDGAAFLCRHLERSGSPGSLSAARAKAFAFPHGPGCTQGVVWEEAGKPRRWQAQGSARPASLLREVRCGCP